MGLRELFFVFLTKRQIFPANPPQEKDISVVEVIPEVPTERAAG
jgi:hypothetical protein